MAMTLRLTDEQDQALEALARAEGISKQEAAVRAITNAAAQRLHADQVTALSETARKRYADLLERLGT
jgi:uncharacterized protein (DUF1778 family)